MEMFGSFGGFGYADLGRGEGWQLAGAGCAAVETRLRGFRQFGSFGSSAVSAVPERSADPYAIYTYDT